ncbi:uncharacterized protein VTP21DRAFT_7630 [Calcarisporiella thermophila]|uniref:uncharacterized protein n=1 Tax=Calcarisporiella thermophila TaxID=911321 RepID=UPI003743417A
MSDSKETRVVLPTNVRPTHYTIKLTPDVEKFTFTGEQTVELEVNQDTTQIVLNSHELNVQSASISNIAVKSSQSQQVTKIEHDEKKETVTLTLAQALPAGSKAALHMQFTGELNDKMAGFYRSSYKDAQGETKYMATTQFEATDARRAFPCWDEPALKATFDVTLVVKEHLTALSNMNVISETKANGFKEVKFARTPIMSTYLIAFVVGELEYIEETTSGEHNNGTPILCRVYTPPGLKEQGRFSLGVGSKSLELFAQVFGQPYPLPKYDMVAIPDFEAGAMENWGLVTFRLNAILFDEKTSDARQKQRIAYTVCHEAAHQWFGNLVTMEWWSELWLNEGFATWVGWFAVDKIFPDWDIWTQFIMDELQSGLRLDALRSSHPIEVPVRDPAEIHQIFDMISYAKGGSVIRMLSGWMGVDVFLAGIRRYLKRHAYGNASTMDLWKALSEESGNDVGEFMTLWTKQVGHPVLTVTVPKAGEIHVRQNRFLSTGDVKPEDDQNLWWVPLSLITDNGEVTKYTLTERESTFKLPGQPTWFKLNHYHTGVYRVLYTPEHIANLGKIVHTLQTGDRVGLVADTGSLAVSGYTKTSAFLDLLRCYENEDKYIVWQEIATRLQTLGMVFSEQEEEVQEALRSFQRQLYSKLAKQLGWEYPEGEDYLTTLLRTLVLRHAGRSGVPEVVAEAKRRFELFAHKNDTSALHPNARSLTYEIVVLHGGQTEFDAVLKIFRETETVDQKLGALQALGFTRKEDLIKRVMELSISDEVKPQDIIYALPAIASSGKGRYLLWQFVQDNWNLFCERYSRSLNLLGLIVKTSTSTFSSEAMLKEIERFFADKDTKDFARPLEQSLETIRVSAQWLERDREDVVSWLQSKGFF